MARNARRTVHCVRAWGHAPCLRAQTIPPVAEASVVRRVRARGGVLPSSQHRLRPNGHTTHVGVRLCHRARLWSRTWSRAESCASARASASAAEPQDGPSTVLSRELEQATGSFGNADASFFAQWVDVGGGGGGGGGNDCGDGTGEGGGGGEGGSAESTRASTGLSFALGVTLDVVCSRTRSSADSRAIHTAQHTSAKMLHRGSVSRCLGLASRGLASISPSLPTRRARWRVVLARPWGVKKRTRGNGLIWGVCGHKVARCRLEVPFSLCALARDADQTFTALPNTS